MTLLIGSIYCCCELGCSAIFINQADYEEHMESEHGESDQGDSRGSDACYAEGIRRVR